MRCRRIRLTLTRETSRRDREMQRQSRWTPIYSQIQRVCIRKHQPRFKSREICTRRQKLVIMATMPSRSLRSESHMSAQIMRLATNFFFKSAKLQLKVGAFPFFSYWAQAVLFKGILKFHVILIEQSVVASGIVYVFLGLVVRDWSCAVEFTNYGEAPTGALATIDFLIIFLILLKIGLKVSTCVRMESVSQSDHPFKSYQKSKCSIYVHHLMRHIRFRVKILCWFQTSKARPFETNISSL